MSLQYLCTNIKISSLQFRCVCVSCQYSLIVMLVIASELSAGIVLMLFKADVSSHIISFDIIIIIIIIIIISQLKSSISLV